MSTKYLDSTGLAYFWNKLKSIFVRKEEVGNTKSFYGTCATEAATTDKVVVCNDFSLSDLVDGVTVLVKFSNTNSGAVDSLTLNVNSTGAYPIKKIYATSSSNAGIKDLSQAKELFEGAVIPFTFTGSYWLIYGVDINQNTTYTLNYTIDAGQYKAGVGNYAVTRYSLLLQKPDYTWEKVTNTSVTYSTGTSKSANTNGFLLNQIVYYGTTAIKANGALLATNTCYRKAASLDLRYSTNCGASPSWQIGDYIYLVGTIGNDDLFYLDTTQWWTNTLPSSNDGKVYIRLGLVLADSEGNPSYNISFLDVRPVLYHDGTKICEYAYPSDNKKADKVSSATSGNFAGLDATGNLTDSGHKHGDYVEVYPVDGFYNNNSTWNLYLPGSFTNQHFVRITIPDSSLNQWTMLYFELSIMQRYSNGLCGKLYFFAMHNSTTGDWSYLKGTIAGNLNTEIKLYASDRKYLYIGGLYGYGSLSIDKLLCGDSIRLVDLTGITLDTVTSLPETYQTGTIYGAGASLTWDSNGLRLLDSMGDVLTTITNATIGTQIGLPSLPLSIANGGTGQTTGNAAANALIGALPQWTADPSDDVYLIRRDTGGSLAFGQVKFSTVWNYIKSKIASVLGIGGSSGVPTAPTAAAGTNTTQIATTAFVQSATSGMAIDTNVVHKAGAETITGLKTFEANVNLTEGATLNMVYDSQTPDGVYLQATEPNGIKAVTFSGISDDGLVQIKNIYVPTDNNDAANKYYVDEEILDIDEYRVYLACKYGPYGVHQKSLCAFCLTDGGREMTMSSFTQKSGTAPKEVITGLVFPIGCKIYYNDGMYDLYPNLSSMANRYYTSFNGVDVRYSAVTGTNISLGNTPTETQSTVYLHVIVENGYWKPYYKEGATTEIIVDSFHMQSGNYYIYLGKTVRNTGYTIQLEDNNPLYYYDGTSLIDYATHLKTVIELQSTLDMSSKADKVEEATSGNLAGLDYSGNLTDSGVAADEVATLGTNQLTNYYKKTEIYSKSETDELIRAASDFEYVEVSTLPTASASTKGKFYLYNGHRYVTTEVTSGVFSWIDLGSYDIDLSEYVTKTVFETEIATRPTYQRLDSEAQMQSMINNHTWVEGVIYYTVEED